MIEKSIKKGEELNDKELYEEAIVEFDSALKENSESFKALLGKSIANQRLNRLDDALNTLLKALQVSRQRNKRENIAIVYFRLSIVYFHKNELGKSLKALNLAKEFGSQDPTFPIWSTKITKKAKSAGVEEQDLDLVQDQKPNPAPGAAAVSQAAVAPSPGQGLKMSYYQSSDRLTVDFFYKNATDPNIVFKTTSLLVEFKTESGSDVYYEYKLFAPVVPEECSFKVMSTKVEVTLKKKTPGKWTAIEGSGNDRVSTFPDASGSSATPLAYPSSSKNKTDWSKFNVDDGDEGDAEAQDENEFFKKLYADADPDTRRAMQKSFIESNGTALSTNWADTKAKTWEVSPPEGTVPKKYNS